MKPNYPHMPEVFLGMLLAASCLFQTGCGSRLAANVQDIKVNQKNATRSPSEACQLLLEAIDKEDRQSVMNMVAQEKVSADTQAITGGRKGFEKFQANAAAISVASVMASLKEIQPAGRKILAESISMGHAEVTVGGTCPNGKELRRSAHFVHENGEWKFVPSKK